MWERGMALLAWKLDGRGTVVGEVVVLGSGVVGGSSGVYRRLKGGRNSKYTAIIKAMQGMTINHEVLLGIRRSKHWGRSELVLEGLETFLTFISPLKLDAFVKQISHRPGNLRKNFDKTAAITSESEKTANLLDGLGRSPVKNSLDTFRGDGNAILGNHMPKVGDFGEPELTLRILSVEFMFSKLP